MKEHATQIASLAALTLILITAVVLTCKGSGDSTLLAILITGAVAIGQQIAGIKPTTPPGTTTATVTQIPPEQSKS